MPEPGHSLPAPFTDAGVSLAGADAGGVLGAAEAGVALAGADAGDAVADAGGVCVLSPIVEALTRDIEYALKEKVSSLPIQSAVRTVT
jgi:hypothetical protein